MMECSLAISVVDAIVKCARSSESWSQNIHDSWHGGSKEVCTAVHDGTSELTAAIR